MRTLADTYFVKAIEGYPYKLEEALENLNYALSYDEDHAGALCLMGRVHNEVFKDYRQAEQYFERALIVNTHHLDTCYYYAFMLIECRDFKRAENLLSHALEIKGADIAVFTFQLALLNEYQKNFSEAIRLYQKAKEDSFNEEYMHKLDLDIKRAQEKRNNSKKIRYSF